MRADAKVTAQDVLRQACRVLIAINEANLNKAQISEHTGLTAAQVYAAIRQLKRERKIITVEHNPASRGGDVYGFNEDWTPRQALAPFPKTPPAVNEEKSARTKVRRVAEAVDAEVRRLPAYVRFRDRKLAVLRRCLERVGPEDRDVLLGIITDYQRGAAS